MRDLKRIYQNLSLTPKSQITTTANTIFLIVTRKTRLCISDKIIRVFGFLKQRPKKINPSHANTCEVLRVDLAI